MTHHMSHAHKSAHAHHAKTGHMQDNLRMYSQNDQSETHYTLPSLYGKIVHEQYLEQPDYCEPGMAGGEMEGDHMNVQAGP